MKKIMKILRIIVITLLVVIITLNIPIITLNKVESDIDYSNWMNENLDNEDLVLDIAMLGAHDAFSNEITYFSDVDPYNDDSIFSGVPGTLLKGFLVKQSVTQTGDVTELLDSGVRYLDIRLSYTDDTWVTKHNYISSEFEPIVEDIISFLDDNPGEFLILDFQHIHGVSYDNKEDYDMFKEMLDTYGILDYAYVTDDLDSVTYGDITNNKEDSKVFIIAPFIDAETEILNYDDSIRSIWANSDNFSYMLEFIEEESVNAESEMDKFRVMQAVTTMQVNVDGIYNSVRHWSLVNRADSFNTYMFYFDDFEGLLETLPIIMVDNADSNKFDFNEDIMELIIEFNTK